MLALSLGLTVLYMYVFGFRRMLDAENIPGIGATLFAVAGLGTAVFYLGHGAKYDIVTVLLLIAAVLLAATCSVYSNPFLGVINCFACAGSGCIALTRMAGIERYTMNQWGVIPNTIGLVCKSLFVNFAKPFRAIGSLQGEGKKRLLGILIGVSVAVPVLAVVIILLCSADEIFGGVFRGIGEWLDDLNAPRVIWYIVRCVCFTLMIFSAMYFLAWSKGGQVTEKEKRKAWSLPFLIVIILLDIIYAGFAAVQFVFLFAGRESAVMQGGFAEYARNGFFQLVAVAIINMSAVLISASCMRHDTCCAASKIAASVLTALTAVILVSAVYRMALYISEYGLSMLRIMTLWAMAMIAVGLGVSTAKLWSRKLRFFPVFFAVCLASWISFNFINPAARVAEYNVYAYLSGMTETVDTEYLEELGPESVKYLRLLEEKNHDHEAQKAAEKIVRWSKDSDWCEWRLFYLLAK